jgi:YD repeat-containing protein
MVCCKKESPKETGNVTNSRKYTYNDKGFLASEQRSDGEIISYTYVYDNFGNWTKKESSKGVIVYRKYTYYN